ncbi:hypothetical protein BK816_03925 [Boudabousia tangfeifanii]|uniref:N-acetyltransferase domain-containing protein n=1 Tax=Boudabousia tangfeifanii TaxID=1912795 RepID=A0A1D9MK51_9ACTO|nr:bifunctional GNAT family N-acetyltransferase/nucleoside triphosphate pyrophosphohydrolase family protein [Boudabousia tangfeifanii]AOZ72550.1 hypothetical protein BK816_03925 [Boudabousia tangfeifanii]
MRASFETTRLSLRPFVASDAATVFASIDEEIKKWTTVPYPYTEESAKYFVTEHVKRISDEQGQLYGIFTKSSQDLVGTIEIRNCSRNEEQNVGSIGLWAAKPFRSQGMLAEALRALATEAFETKAYYRLEYRAEVENWSSRALAWACGFEFEGIARKSMPPTPWAQAQGETDYRDIAVYSLLAGDRTTPNSRWLGPLPGQPSGPKLADSHRPDQLVRQFHETYDCPILDEPSLEIERLGMRMDLILEEACELVGAVYGASARKTMELAWQNAKAEDDGTRDLVETADALGDLIYVIYGMALETGIDLPAVLSQVQASNLSKLDADGSVIYREDGKVLKGPNFFGPRIAEVLGLSRD